MDIGKLIVIIFVGGIIIGGLIVYFKNHPLSKPEYKDKKDSQVIVSGAGMSMKEAQLITKTQAEINEKNNPKPVVKEEEKPRMVKCHACGERVLVNDEKICSNCGESIEHEIAELVKAEQMMKIMLMNADLKREAQAQSNANKSDATSRAISLAANLVLPGSGHFVANAINKKMK